MSTSTHLDVIVEDQMLMLVALQQRVSILQLKVLKLQHCLGPPTHHCFHKLIQDLQNMTKAVSGKQTPRLMATSWGADTSDAFSDQQLLELGIDSSTVDMGEEVHISTACSEQGVQNSSTVSAGEEVQNSTAGPD